METITLPATIDTLTVINKILEKTLSGKLEHMLFKTELVVEELLANICSYAYDRQNGGNAYFVCGEVNFDGKSCIMIQITDDGKAYDPFLNCKDPDLNAPLEERPIGGLGLHLVKEIATHYAYFRIDNKNQTQIILDIDNNDM